MSGKLDRTVGGQPVNLTDEPYTYRRSVYGYVDRGNLPELMQNFDFSNPDMPNSRAHHHHRAAAGALPHEQPHGVDVARRVFTRREVRRFPRPTTSSACRKSI